MATTLILTALLSFAQANQPAAATKAPEPVEQVAIFGGGSGKQPKQTRFREVEQRVQNNGLYAPEVGRIVPGTTDPSIRAKPEMDMDPREPLLVPAEPEEMPSTDQEVPTIPS